MRQHALVCALSLALASSAFAGATVDFLVTDFGNTPCSEITGCVFGPALTGSFQGGETVLVHVMVTSDASFSIRGAQIDSRASSPELGLGQDIDAVSQGLDGIPNFWFDYSSISVGGVFAQGTYPATGFGPFGSSTGGYADFSNLEAGAPLVDFPASTAWASPTGSPSMLRVDAGVPFRLGGMAVTLPSATPGAADQYTLDVLNLANLDDANFGMVLDFGFGLAGDPVTKWASAAGGVGVDDVITYANGPLTLTVEPLMAPDADGDLVEDALDVCVFVPDPAQQDTDGDDYGNACDCDFNQDLGCSIADFNVFLPAFQSTVDPGNGTDMDGNGAVGIADFTLFLPGFQAGVPGPSGVAACIAEGDSRPVVPGALPCCLGLDPIPCDSPIANVCEICVGASICAACGNGVCGLGENPCNCPQDCPP